MTNWLIIYNLNSFTMDDLLIKYILEETTPEESKQVQQWLAADATHQARFDKLQSVWKLAAQPGLPFTAQTPQALQRLKQTLQARQAVPVKRMWARTGAAAAAVVGITGMVLGAYVILQPKTPVKKIIPVVQPDTVHQLQQSVDTLPVTPADTTPVVKPHKKKTPVPVKPVQPARPKKKAVQPSAATAPVHPVPARKRKMPL